VLLWVEVVYGDNTACLEKEVEFKQLAALAFGHLPEPNARAHRWVVDDVTYSGH
jgi:hypothetical protein